MADRKPLSKKVRFEVLKRDSFTCQYCGAKAPDVILHVDHIKPVSAGGEDTLLNFVTACAPCNLGKGDRELSDQSALEKRRAQLEELNERREQLEMLVEWQEGLSEIDDMQVDAVANSIERNWSCVISESGRRHIKTWVKKFGVTEILKVISDFEPNIVYGEDGTADSKSINKAFDAIPKICGFNRACKRDPALREIAYIRGILRNRLSYVNEGLAVRYMREALDAGVPTAFMQDIAKTCRSWTHFCEQLEQVQR